MRPILDLETLRAVSGGQDDWEAPVTAAVRLAPTAPVPADPASPQYQKIVWTW